ncbi:peptidoglycan bridge formation glycyltransferase FemA/FemB family protein [Candidatus Pacearchaeota archaeon]|nr:peptidoglycan bridge formation glycyltransferase FemA/FemB family protein [Candidatus Pacearchaeota archaeon]
MAWKGFKDIQATIEIDLTKTLEELWKGLDKDARWGVNKAKKEGLIMQEAKEEDWQKFYPIYADTCKRGIIPPLPLEETKKSKLFVCKKDANIIAGAAVKQKDEKIELFLNASLPKFLNLQPNNLIYWGLIEYGKNNNFKVLDLGGYQLKAKPGNKLYEVNRFKERWGGRIVTYHIHSKNPLYILGRKIIRNFPVAKKIRDKMRMIKSAT